MVRIVSHLTATLFHLKAVRTHTPTIAHKDKSMTLLILLFKYINGNMIKHFARGQIHLL